MRRSNLRKPLWPRSLHGRLVLLLLTVLSVAQLGSALLHLEDRSEILYEAQGLQAVERIVALIRLLDEMPPSERQQVAHLLSTWPLAIMLTDRAEQNPLLEPAPSLMRYLRARLGSEHSVYAGIQPPPTQMQAEMDSPWPDSRHRGMHRRMRMRDMLPGAVFQVQAQLDDGTWVRIQHGLTEEGLGWPWKLALALGLLLAAVVVVALIAVRWLIQPLETLADAADALGRDIRRPPLAEIGPAEVRVAAHAFNTMQARLLRFIEDRTGLLSAVSHDLKTPVTRLRLRTELLDDSQLKTRFQKDLDEMEALVNGALEFMRGLDTEEPSQAMDINELIDTVRADWEDSGYPVQVEGSAHRPYVGRPRALKRCLANLVDNACRYGAPAAIAIRDTDELLSISVLDSGPGIPEAELERVFEPFRRLEESRSRTTGGTGLGLAIARNIARAHGGEVTLHNRPSGGLEAQIKLPRSAIQPKRATSNRN